MTIVLQCWDNVCSRHICLWHDQFYALHLHICHICFNNLFSSSTPLFSWSLGVFWNGWDNFILNFSFSVATNCACWDKAQSWFKKKKKKTYVGFWCWQLPVWIEIKCFICLCSLSMSVCFLLWPDSKHLRNQKWLTEEVKVSLAQVELYLGTYPGTRKISGMKNKSWRFHFQ